MQIDMLPGHIEAQDRPTTGSTDWFSVIQFGLSTLAVLILWGMALSALLVGISERLGGTMPVANDLQIFMFAAGMAFCGVLLLPSAWYSLSRIIGRPVEKTLGVIHRLRPTLLILAYPVLIGLGYWISQSEAYAWLLLPPIHVLAISLPLLWLAYLGVRDLPSGSPQRATGVFSSGLVVAPPLILLAEVIAIITGLGAFIAVVAMRPELAESLTSLAERLMAAAPAPEVALRILQPLLRSPAVIMTALLFGAIIVPLIEELIKPFGVWLLAGRDLTPAEGFTAGVLSGTGFALIESLFMVSSGQDWAILTFARIGTGVMHILTSGLVGWALVKAWTKSGSFSGYVRLGAVYLLAVMLHGLWNGLALISTFASLIEEPIGSGLFMTAGQITPYLLGTLAAGTFLALLSVNRALVRRQAVQAEDV
jgi:hypothetical protein